MISRPHITARDIAKAHRGRRSASLKHHLSGFCSLVA